jgi:hypothetical protein
MMAIDSPFNFVFTNGANTAGNINADFDLFYNSSLSTTNQFLANVSETPALTNGVIMSGPTE